MHSENFIKKAIRTESQVDSIKVDKEYLSNLIKRILRDGEKLDNIKKYVFYGKEFKNEELQEYYLKQHEKVVGVNPRIFHGILGIITENIELLEILYDNIYNGKEIDKKDLELELGDGDWYRAIISDEMGYKIEDSWENVIKKLQKRFPEKFDSDRAINKDVEEEKKNL